ncbi:hypothetical protein FACS189447_08160 [Spirochaetia bacterium]|nr:hypothetical protein FACS189447_08160 [Spirochaetia bacterium]
MKRISILFLLAVVLVSFTFAIDGVGDFKAKVNVAVSDLQDSDAMDVVIEPSIGFSTAFENVGPGTLGLGATVVFPIDLNLPGDDIGLALKLDALSVSYSLAAGPGTLKFWLDNYTGFILAPDTDDKLEGALKPGVNYALPAGPGTLTVESGTEFWYAKAVPTYDPTLTIVYGKVAYAADFGLTGSYKFVYDLDASIIGANELDVNYKITDDPILAGVTVTLPADFDFDAGLGVKPYAEAHFGAIGVGFEVPFGNIAAAAGDVTIGLGIWGSYSF